MSRINLAAIGVGACVNMGGTFFVAFIVNSAAMHLFLSRGVAASSLGAALATSPLLMVALFSIATFFAVLGGYAAARIAGHAFFVHSFGSGLPVLFVNVIALSNPLPSYQPLWMYVLGLVLCIPLALLGAYFAKKAT